MSDRQAPPTSLVMLLGVPPLRPLPTLPPLVASECVWGRIEQWNHYLPFLPGTASTQRSSLRLTTIRLIQFARCPWLLPGKERMLRTRKMGEGYRLSERWMGT
ncbi:hypothetical protein ElyMa_003355800 [Elysia marginata]|uniref:Secreted protein n=1 Tax=Elysia marginata TaxID=1093978 RepID=A0AAV4JK86_9GAST|nr:hypothetical protein ElyMa_003355800 [Elysia marginata]